MENSRVSGSQIPANAAAYAPVVDSQKSARALVIHSASASIREEAFHTQNFIDQQTLGSATSTEEMKRAQQTLRFQPVTNPSSDSRATQRAAAVEVTPSSPTVPEVRYKGFGGRPPTLNAQGNAEMQKGNLMALNAKMRGYQSRAETNAKILETKNIALDALLAIPTEQLSLKEQIDLKKEILGYEKEIKDLKASIEKDEKTINELKAQVNPAKAKAEAAFKAYEVSDGENARNLKMARKLKELNSNLTIDQALQDVSLSNEFKSIKDSTSSAQFKPIMESEYLNLQAIEKKQSNRSRIVEESIRIQARADNFTQNLQMQIEHNQTSEAKAKPSEHKTSQDEHVPETWGRSASAPVMQSPARIMSPYPASAPFIGAEHQAKTTIPQTDNPSARSAEQQAAPLTAVAAAAAQPHEQKANETQKADAQKEASRADRPEITGASPKETQVQNAAARSVDSNLATAPEQSQRTAASPITPQIIHGKRQELLEVKNQLEALIRQSETYQHVSVNGPQPQAQPEGERTSPSHPQLGEQIATLKEIDTKLYHLEAQLKGAPPPTPGKPASSTASMQPPPVATASGAPLPDEQVKQKDKMEMHEKRQEAATQLLAQAESVKNQAMQIVSEETVRRSGAAAAAQVFQETSGGPKPSENEDKPLPGAPTPAQDAGNEQGDSSGGQRDQSRQQANPAANQEAKSEAKPESRVGSTQKTFAGGFTGTVEEHQWGTTAHLIKTVGGKQFHVTLDFYGPADENKINEYLREKESMEKIDNMMKEYAVFSRLGKKDFVIESTYKGGSQMRYTSKTNDARKTENLGYPEGYLKGKIERYERKIERAQSDPARLQKLKNKQVKMRNILAEYQSLVLQKKTGMPFVTMETQEVPPARAAATAQHVQAKQPPVIPPKPTRLTSAPGRDASVSETSPQPPLSGSTEERSVSSGQKGFKVSEMTQNMLIQFQTVKVTAEGYAEEYQEKIQEKMEAANEKINRMTKDIDEQQKQTTIKLLKDWINAPSKDEKAKLKARLLESPLQPKDLKIIENHFINELQILQGKYNKSTNDAARATRNMAALTQLQQELAIVQGDITERSDEAKKKEFRYLRNFLEKKQAQITALNMAIANETDANQKLVLEEEIDKIINNQLQATKSYNTLQIARNTNEDIESKNQAFISAIA